MNDLDFIEMVRPRALCNPPTLWNTLKLTRLVIADNIPGAFVECGVFCGSHPAIMAYAGDDRTVHLFDSFQGIPQAGAHDDCTITSLLGEGDGSLRTTGISACSVENVKSHMREWGIDPARLVYHAGWFEETLPVTDIGAIALLRLDGDLYSSTKACLDHLYPKVSIGGYVIVDDYNLTGCRKAVHEYLDAWGMKPDIHEVDGGYGPVYWQVDQ